MNVDDMANMVVCIYGILVNNLPRVNFDTRRIHLLFFVGRLARKSLMQVLLHTATGLPDVTYGHLKWTSRIEAVDKLIRVCTSMV